MRTVNVWVQAIADDPVQMRELAYGIGLLRPDETGIRVCVQADAYDPSRRGSVYPWLGRLTKGVLVGTCQGAFLHDDFADPAGWNRLAEWYQEGLLALDGPVPYTLDAEYGLRRINDGISPYPNLEAVEQAIRRSGWANRALASNLIWYPWHYNAEHSLTLTARIVNALGCRIISPRYARARRTPGMAQMLDDHALQLANAVGGEDKLVPFFWTAFSGNTPYWNLFSDAELLEQTLQPLSEIWLYPDMGMAHWVRFCRWVVQHHAMLAGAF